MEIFFESIGTLAGICVAIPSIPQIWRTYKSKNVKGLSLQMFFIRLTGGICYALYGRYLGSLTMMIFNGISAGCSLTNIILIFNYRKI
jgi:MtN3 and saliva related transmembrane protein